MALDQYFHPRGALFFRVLIQAAKKVFFGLVSLLKFVFLIQLVRSYDLLIGMPVLIEGKRKIDTALRTSPLLLDNVKPHVMSLNVAGMLNIHGKRLNIWINIHILCWLSHMPKALQ